MNSRVLFSTGLLLVRLSLVVVIDANWVLQWEFGGQPESSIG